MKDGLFNFVKINKEHLLISLLFITSLFSFFIFTKTLNSGYHFIDDHCLISMESNLESSLFLKVGYTYVKNDFLIRFRPAFYIYYISFLKVFGLDFFWMSAFVGFVAFLSTLFFYYGLRNLKFSMLESILFVCLIFIGTQSSIWWRLGVAETVCVFFLSLAFFFMTKCSKKEKYKLNNILFIIFLIIASLCKESFIIIIPAFVFFKIWNEKRFFNTSLKESIKNNYLLFLPIIIMFIELVIIKFIVGTNQIGYAGVTSSANEFLIGIKNIIFNKISLLNWFKFLGYSLAVYFASFIFLRKNKKEKFIQSMKFFIPNLTFVLLIVLPQIFMHAKSGMVERYLLPTTFGLAFLVVVILKDVKLKFFKFLILILFCIFITNSFLVARDKAIIFAKDGIQTNFLLDTVKENIDKEDNFLLVTDPVSRFEVSNSIKIYLSYYGYDNLYVYPILKNYKTEFEIGLKDQWMKWFENRKLEDIEDEQQVPNLIIIFDERDSERFFLETKIEKNDYNVVVDSERYPYKYEIYIKKQF